MERTESDFVQIQPASILDDLRQAPLFARYLAAFIGSALGTYFLCFGILAICGYWVHTFLSPMQILPALGLLVAQALLLWICKVRPLIGSVICGTVWTIPVLVALLRLADSRDAFQVPLMILLPATLSICMGFSLSRLLPKLELPECRGQAL